MNKNTRYILILFILMPLVFFQNCSGVNLEQYKVSAYSVSDINVDICTTRPSTILSNLKFIFVQDRSGSNQVRYDLTTGATLPGTDATGIRRFPPLIDFLNNFTGFNPAYTYYSFVNFATNSNPAQFNYTDPYGRARTNEAFTNDRTQFVNYINNQARPPYTDNVNPADGGNTNYRDAMLDVRTIIDTDIRQAEDDFLNGVTTSKIASNYVIFFVSDGEPIDGQDIDGDGVLDVQPLVDILQVIQDINNFQNTKTDYVDGITLNTAYYYSDPASALARTYLQRMAQDGNGTFLEFSNGQEIDFSRFAVPSRIARFTLRELWVVNANTVWQGDYLAPDIDADGISDFDEIQLGSNPSSYDSDGNGLGDGIELKLYGQPCVNANCALPGAGTSQCTTFQSATGSAGMVDTDLDDLNDCEEVFLKTDRRDPDTNNDYIPDGLALKSGIKVSSPSSAGSVDPDYDQLTDYQEIKYNSPLNINNSLVPNLRLTQYYSKLVSSTVDQDCYHFDIADLVFQNRTDRMRVYIIESTKVLNNRTVIRRAEVPSAYGIASLTDADFVTYQP